MKTKREARTQHTTTYVASYVHTSVFIQDQVERISTKNSSNRPKNKKQIQIKTKSFYIMGFCWFALSVKKSSRQGNSGSEVRRRRSQSVRSAAGGVGASRPFARDLKTNQQKKMRSWPSTRRYGGGDKSQAEQLTLTLTSALTSTVTRTYQLFVCVCKYVCNQESRQRERTENVSR